jgi:hypothetical protein
MNGHASGVVRLLLRIEGLVVLAAGVCAYARLGASWTTFALFLLAPDLSWLGYLCLRQRVGTHAKRLQEILPKYLAPVNRPHFGGTWTSPTSQSCACGDDERGSHFRDDLHPLQTETNYPGPRRSLNATIIPRRSPDASIRESCSTALDSGRTPTTDRRRPLVGQ